MIHRKYRVKGGEDVFLHEALIPTLAKLKASHTLEELPPLFSDRKLILSDVLELLFMTVGLERWRPSYKYLRNKMNSGGFTHVLFNNFIPTISLALPKAAKELGIKTFAFIHNARLSCANGLNFNGHEACTRCLDFGSRYSLFFNCQRNWFQSLLYALVYRRQRVGEIVGGQIDVFYPVSQYTLDNLKASFQKLSSTPLTARVIRPVIESQLKGSGDYQAEFSEPFYLFLGRISFEKGTDKILDLAASFPRLQFVIAGEGPLRQQLESQAQNLKNLRFTGNVQAAKKAWLLQNAKALVMPSRVMENAPLVLFETQAFQTPVIYTKGGGAEELVKFLNRSGCTLEDFKGQDFPRTGNRQLPRFGQEFSKSFFTEESK